MRPLTTVVPKPLLPLGDRPILHHVLDEVREAGADPIFVLVDDGAPSLVRTHIERVFAADPLSYAIRIHPVALGKTAHPVPAVEGCGLASGTPAVLAHCDEVVPTGVTRSMAAIAQRTDCMVAAVLNPASTGSRLVRLRQVEAVAAPPVESSGAGRLAGRLAVPTGAVELLNSGVMGRRCRTLVEVAAAWIEDGGTLLAIEWPGPYVDVGELNRYRSFWKEDLGGWSRTAIGGAPAGS